MDKLEKAEKRLNEARRNYYQIQAEFDCILCELRSRLTEARRGLEESKEVLASTYFKPKDDEGARLKKLEDALQTQSLPLEEVAPLYAELMSAPLPEGRYPALSLTPQQKREATLDAVSGP